MPSCLRLAGFLTLGRRSFHTRSACAPLAAPNFAAWRSRGRNQPADSGKRAGRRSRHPDGPLRTREEPRARSPTPSGGSKRKSDGSRGPCWSRDSRGRTTVTLPSRSTRRVWLSVPLAGSDHHVQLLVAGRLARDEPQLGRDPARSARGRSRSRAAGRPRPAGTARPRPRGSPRSPAASALRRTRGRRSRASVRTVAHHQARLRGSRRSQRMRPGFATTSVPREVTGLAAAAGVCRARGLHEVGAADRRAPTRIARWIAARRAPAIGEQADRFGRGRDGGSGSSEAALPFAVSTIGEDASRERPWPWERRRRCSQKRRAGS